tara:strand:+ start:266 stop:553 length:288 start_codon:yes stop_codon:yes gene_type:complete
MFGFLLTILKNIVLKLATTGAFNFMMPTLLKIDKWCEDKIGLDIIKQEKRWFEKYPLLKRRIEALEKDSHPPCPLECFEGYDDLIKRVEKLESKK